MLSPKSKIKSEICKRINMNAISCLTRIVNRGMKKQQSKKMKIEAENAERSIYMDFQATTPVDPRVLDKMMPYFGERFGNPHSRTHNMGWEAELAVEKARAKIASVINTNEKDIIFTSGATESNNLAIKGFMRGNVDQKNHVITDKIEHKCVLNACLDLEREGFKVDVLPTDKYGRIDLELLERTITPKTGLVSIMAVNNEIGTIQDLKSIGKICRSNGVKFHTDAAQAFGKIPLDVDELNIDLMSISGHKIYGPMGVGALYVRRKPRVRLFPLLSGGGQERGIRSGTLPAPLLVGFGEAAKIAQEEMFRDEKHIRSLSEHLISSLNERVQEIELNGHAVFRIPGCANITFKFVEGESLLMALPKIALSSGSACTSASLEPSYVLRSLGVDEENAHSSIRFGMGRFTTLSEIDSVVSMVQSSVEKLRQLSPLWDMHMDGVDISSIKWTH